MNEIQSFVNLHAPVLESGLPPGVSVENTLMGAWSATLLFHRLDDGSTLNLSLSLLWRARGGINAYFWLYRKDARQQQLKPVPIRFESAMGMLRQVETSLRRQGYAIPGDRERDVRTLMQHVEGIQAHLRDQIDFCCGASETD